jgi:phosphatidylserine synthase
VKNIKSFIPNAITALNLLSGLLAVIAVLENEILLEPSLMIEKIPHMIVTLVRFL